LIEPRRKPYAEQSENTSDMREFPPRYDFRLEDLRAWHVVEASCRRCRHRAPVAHGALLRDRLPYTRLFELERALRCQRCGARGQASLAIKLRPRECRRDASPFGKHPGTLSSRVRRRTQSTSALRHARWNNATINTYRLTAAEPLRSRLASSTRARPPSRTIRRIRKGH
jgi:hypothetical protein